MWREERGKGRWREKRKEGERQFRHIFSLTCKHEKSDRDLKLGIKDFIASEI